MPCRVSSVALATKSEARVLCILREELARGDALADTMFALQALGSYPITLAGDANKNVTICRKVASGDAIAAFAITEPEAGSDVASLKTTAVRQADQFRFERYQAVYFQCGHRGLLCCLRVDGAGEKG